MRGEIAVFTPWMNPVRVDWEEPRADLDILEEEMPVAPTGI